MNSKRTVWIAEGGILIFGIVAMFLHYDLIASACAGGFLGLLSKLVEK
jgi:hypothetical protein